MPRPTAGARARSGGQAARRLARGTLSAVGAIRGGARLTRDACWLVTFVEERHDGSLRLRNPPV